MFNKKGFTLIEILVVLIIISVLAAVAIPNYMVYVQQQSARAAQNNLVTMYNAEKNFYLGTIGSGNYCTNAAGNCPGTSCCDNITDVDTNLSLNISDNYFSYACSTTNGFTCTATNNQNHSFTLQVTGGTASSPESIILVGASTCATGTAAGCNPSCTNAANPGYCPS